MKDSRDIAACAPELQAKGNALIAAFWKRFAPFYLTPIFTQRSPATHEALWLQGRTSLDVVNRARNVAGLPPITAQQNMNQVTWTKHSRHLMVPSEAIDLAITLDPDGPTGPMKPVIEWEDEARYEAMAAMAVELGLVSGGPKDLGHVELARKAPVAVPV